MVLGSRKRKLIAVAGILLVFGVLIFRNYKKLAPEPAEIHYHAGFVVFDKGGRMDFSDSKYMNIKPCEIDSHTDPSPEEIQMDKAHLHDGVGDVVHVHTAGSRWSDLFTNITYPVDYINTIAYINGAKVGDLADEPIKPYDSLVLFVGEADEKLLLEAVTQDRITEVESTSIECGD